MIENERCSLQHCESDQRFEVRWRFWPGRDILAVFLRCAGVVNGGTTDPGRLRQVLLDLIENADKYSPKETPIRLVLRQSTSAVLTRISDRSLHSRRRGLPRCVSWSRDDEIPGSSELMLMWTLPS